MARGGTGEAGFWQRPCIGSGGGNDHSIQRTHIAIPMKPTTATAARPNRVLIALATAWMILSLAIGGAVSADSDADGTAPVPVTGTTEP